MTGIELACKYHDGQFRKGKASPAPLSYIVHPMAVMHLISQWGAGTQEMLDAAICHDLLEDTSCSFEEMVDVIGLGAGVIVNELTFQPDDASPKNIQKEKYLSNFLYKSPQALLIKLADRLLNVADFAYEDEKYAAKYMNKADVLFEIATKRQTEIESCFSVRTFEQYKSAVFWQGVKLGLIRVSPLRT